MGNKFYEKSSMTKNIVVVEEDKERAMEVIAILENIRGGWVAVLLFQARFNLDLKTIIAVNGEVAKKSLIFVPDKIKK